MSLIIRGMDMPKNCYHCRFNYDNLCHALQLSFSYIRGNDNISCPLIEISTPHGRLIDEDNLRRCIKEVLINSDVISVFEYIIERQPTIIEAEASAE